MISLIFLSSLLTLLGFTFWLGAQGQKDFSGNSDFPKGEEMRPFIYLGLFYINPDDPRSWLPKIRPSWGWTINFKNRRNAHFFLFLIITVLGSTLFITHQVLKL